MRGENCAVDHARDRDPRHEDVLEHRGDALERCLDTINSPDRQRRHRGDREMAEHLGGDKAGRRVSGRNAAAIRKCVGITAAMHHQRRTGSSSSTAIRNARTGQMMAKPSAGTLTH